MEATKKEKEAIVKEEERTAAESLNKEISNVGARAQLIYHNRGEIVEP